MINRLFASLFFLVLSTTLHAQETVVGVIVGPNISTVVGDLTDSYKPRLGYHYGLFAEISISKKLSFKPEISYSSIGFLRNVDFRNNPSFLENPSSNILSFKSAQRANYLVVPLAVRIKFSNRFGLEIGPQTSFLLNSVSKLKDSSDLEGQETRYSSPGDFRLDFGATLGAGLNLNEKLSIRLRYYHGLHNLFRGSLGNFANYHRALQLSFGYSFFKIKLP